MIKLVMNDPVITYTSAGLKLLFSQLSQTASDQPIEFIDPMCTTIRICTLCFKQIGTKLSIHNNTLTIQEPWTGQGFSRWMNGDDRDKLYQLKLPLFYFRGVVLGFLTFDHLEIDEQVLTYINDLTVKGLKRMRMTYENDKKSGSLIKNTLDEYVKILTTIYNVNDYTFEMYQYNKPTLFAIYNEYTKMWQTNDYKILYSLFSLIEHEENIAIQNRLADCINLYVTAKDLKIDTIRPD